MSRLREWVLTCSEWEGCGCVSCQISRIKSFWWTPEAEQLDETLTQQERKKSTYRRNECNRMIAPRFRVGSSIFREVAKEEINGPCRRMPKLCELSWIWPEHEACNHSFQLATIVSSLLHYIIMGLVPGVRSIQFIVNTLLVTSEWRLPEPFERHEVEILGRRLCKYCSYDIKDWPVAKAIHREH